MLNEYKKKRDFKRTTEPKPEKKESKGPLVFVVQKHAARRLHYDFRLELEGVLKSWAVPAGPSLDPGVKRLAVMVEDHPFDYRSFEGTIPKGEYGAGQVIIWDKGTYSPDKEGQLFFEDRAKAQEIMRETLKTGKIKIFLRGDRLKGSWALVKMQRGDNEWLLIKHKDEFASSSGDILKEDSSISSGLSIEDIKKGIEKSAVDPAKLAGAEKGGYPESLSPMLATLIKKPFSDPAWLFEPKLDGYRILSFVRDGNAKLISRNGIDVTREYPAIAKNMAAQPTRDIILDGEVIALDEKGRSCFQCLQNRSNGKMASGPLAHSAIYYVFDILYLNGYDLKKVALFQRKQALKSVFSPSENVRLIEFFEGSGKELYEAAIKNGFEGAIAKRLDSTYEPGHRSRNWLKIKSTLSDEFIIGGFTKGTGNRAGTFGALLLGSYDSRGNLDFAGHVGTGFDQTLLLNLKKRMDAIKTRDSPFVENPALNAPATWVKPEMVAEIKYSERTQDGFLRTPVFLRLREDKSPSEVGHFESTEKNVPAPNTSAAGLESILEQLSNPKSNLILQVEDHKIKLSNLDKPIWPPSSGQKALTKRDLLIYLAQVSSYILPHLRDRPLALTRYPNGIGGKRFFQKHFETPSPEFLNKVSLSEHSGIHQDYLICNNMATLIWLGQMANIDIHTWFSRVTPEPVPVESTEGRQDPDILTEYPDFIVFDMDPYIYSGKEPEGAEPEFSPQAFNKTCEIALQLKEVLDSLKLASFVKTSGRTGLHVYVPIRRQLDFQAVHSAARTICEYVQMKNLKEVTVDWAVEKRRGKIFLDYNQNVRGKTLASVYSPRAAPLGTVSTPLGWDEVGRVLPSDFTILTVPDRLASMADLWEDILNKRNDIKDVLGINPKSDSH